MMGFQETSAGLFYDFCLDGHSLPIACCENHQASNLELRIMLYELTNHEWAAIQCPGCVVVPMMLRHANRFLPTPAMILAGCFFRERIPFLS
jgi:hypothetical protein